MQLTSTSKAISNINCLVYGESGVGKTYLCSTAPKPLIISAEAGLLSLSGFDLPVFEIKKRSDLDEIYDWIRLSNDAKSIETICIDSLSEIGEVLLTDEKKRTKDARQAYGVMNDELAVAIRGFRDLPKNVYFAAKLKKLVEESTGAVNYLPSLPGKQMLDNLPYFFDLVLMMDYGRLDNGMKYRYLQTVGDRTYIAKDRSGVLLPQEKPDLGYIFRKIMDSHKAVPPSENTKTEAKEEPKEEKSTPAAKPAWTPQPATK